jgi:signal transduction histidine kinase/CheY-like chemotaxis protein
MEVSNFRLTIAYLSVIAMKLSRLKQSFSFLFATKLKPNVARDRGIPLKMLLLVPFLLQIFIVVGLVGWFSFRNGQHTIDKLVDRLRGEIFDEVEHHLEDSFSSSTYIDRLNRQAFELEMLTFTNTEDTKQKFLKQLQVFKDVEGIYFASAAGQFIRVSRQQGNSFSADLPTQTKDIRSPHSIDRISINDKGKFERFLKTYNFDPRWTQWYKNATAVGGSKAISIVPNEDNPQELVMLVNSPLYLNDKLIGTIGVSQSLKHISGHLQTHNKTESGEVFVIEPNGYLIASSTLEPLTVKTANETHRVSILNSSDPKIRATGKFLQSQFFDLGQIKTEQKLSFTFNNTKQLVKVRPWQNDLGLDCLVVMTMPASDFMSEAKLDRSVTIAICLLALSIATVTSLLTAEAIAKPIGRLSILSKAIASKKKMVGLEDHLQQQLSFNNIHEVRVLSRSFYDMISQLQEWIELLELRVSERTSELTVAKESAELANRSKSDFLTNMSHEVRTPLNAILGFCQLMQRDNSLSQEHQESLTIVIRSGEHLLSLINDVLDLSKIEAGRAALWETDFDLHTTLQNVVGMLQLRAEAKGLELWCEIAPEVPQFIHADEKKLRQVLINLIGNSIKFTERGRIVLKAGVMQSETVSLISEIEVLEFAIEDTGVGIAANEIDMLFQPFTQSKSGRDSQQGTGLGLSLTKQFVEIMAGDISVRSQLDRGSCFTFHIPIQVADSAQIAPTKEYRKVIKLQPNQPEYRILVVDDRWENRQLMFKLLADVGFEVRMAKHGKEAVEIWESWDSHLIWMDMRMPVMNGYEAVEAIRSHVKGQATVIIALTASTFEEERMLILSAGCDDFVRKPFLEATIFEKLQVHLGVEYIYEDLQSPSSAPTLLELDGETLTVMPLDWLLEFQQAAMELDREKIEELLDRISSEHDRLPRAISQLVDNFEFDRLISHTQDAIEQLTETTDILQEAREV